VFEWGRINRATESPHVLANRDLEVVSAPMMLTRRFAARLYCDFQTCISARSARLNGKLSQPCQSPASAALASGIMSSVGAMQSESQRWMCVSRPRYRRLAPGLVTVVRRRTGGPLTLRR